ncbi:MAG: metal-dependent hydrolase [Thermoplasmata archaeon]|nr:metal-dependent hydrolase [Thermoplasmata archaeon]MCI4356631.1 metal-dependent hydrolase [Thermoplasmata archaeon]
MDLFTHVVFAYLLSFVIWGPASPQYIAAGALAGGLPDADALLFPLARRFPLLEHHGITHSILGVTLVAVAGSFLLPFLPYFPHASTFLYFVAMEIGGLSHVFLDGFTHFAVTPFLPLSLRQLRLDADVAINIAMLTLTSVTLVTLSLERGTVPFTLWVETAWLLSAIYGAYLLMRGVARWRADVARKREGYSHVAPTTNPRVWMLLDQDDSPERYRIRYRRYRFGESVPSPARSMEVAKVARTSGPVRTPQEALERTYAAAMEHNGWMAMRAHAGEAVEQGNVFEVRWYIVEVAGFGRTLGVRGTIDRSTGEMRLRSGFFRRPTGGPG